MQIQVVSDLHLEFGSISMPPVDRDLLILAGDIGVGLEALDYIKTECRRSPVILILGNHEYYRQDFNTLRSQWRRVDLENFHFLENNTFELNGITFLGCTLWTDLDHGNENTIHNVQYGLNDYSLIKRGSHFLTPFDTIQTYNASMHFLEDELSLKRKTVVITHHAPSHRSIPLMYRESILNGAFVNSMDDLIITKKPVLWIHGHVHQSHDYYIDRTRILCNPRGYCNVDANDHFKPDLILKL